MIQSPSKQEQKTRVLINKEATRTNTGMLIKQFSKKNETRMLIKLDVRQNKEKRFPLNFKNDSRAPLPLQKYYPQKYTSGSSLRHLQK